MLAGWDPDATWWLNDILSITSPPQDWRKDGQAPSGWTGLSNPEGNGCGPDVGEGAGLASLVGAADDGALGPTASPAAFHEVLGRIHYDPATH